MKTGAIGTTSVAICLCALSGCPLVSPVRVEARKHVLDQIPTDTRSEETHPATLIVLVPETEAIYDTTQMVYMTRAHEVGYFSQNEWAETPSRMMQPLIVQTIRNTHHFSEVLSQTFWSPNLRSSNRDPGAPAGLHFGPGNAAARSPFPADSRVDESGHCDERIVCAGTHAGKDPLRRGGRSQWRYGQAPGRTGEVHCREGRLRQHSAQGIVPEHEMMP
jgi:ABC-type transport auxiliary lipoprotein component